MRCSPASTNEHRSTTERTGSSTRTSRSCAPPATSIWPCPPSSEAPGSGLDELLGARPPPRLRGSCDGAGRQHARVLDRRRRRPAAQRRRLLPLHPGEGSRGRGLRRPPRRGRQRHPCAPVELQRRAGRRGMEDQRPQDLRQPHAGVDLRRLPRHGHVGSGRSEDRPRLPPTRHAGAARSWTPGTPWACAQRRARTQCSTRRSAPTS